MKRTTDQITNIPNEFGNLSLEALSTFVHALDFLNPNNPDMLQIFSSHYPDSDYTTAQKRDLCTQDGGYGIDIRKNKSHLASKDIEHTIKAEKGWTKQGDGSPYDGPITRMDSLIRKIAPFITSIVPPDIIDQALADGDRPIEKHDRLHSHELNLSIKVHDNKNLNLIAVFEENLSDWPDPTERGFLQLIAKLHFPCMKIFGWLLENEDMIREAYTDKTKGRMERFIERFREPLLSLLKLCKAK